MIQYEQFFEFFFKRLDKSYRQLESYIDDPSEENIHNVRISIRRLESAYSVIPKSSRTKKSDRLVSMYMEFFSLNNIVRNRDIILQKLEVYGYPGESQISLATNRKKLKRLLLALDLAEKIIKSKKPKLKKISASSKFEKTILTMVKEFNIYVSAVTNNENNVDELHSMRKLVKKIRYVLEMHPAKTYDGLLANLKSLQTLLGSIHDCDVFIRYLGKNKKQYPDMSKIVESEKVKRSTAYKQLVLALGSFAQGK